MVWSRGLLLLFASFSIVGSVPVVHADPVESLLPPEALSAHYDAQANTVRLDWLPPGSDMATAFLYTVYRNGQAIGTTTQTWLDASLLDVNAFTVTATSSQGESIPSSPLIIQKILWQPPVASMLSLDPSGLILNQCPWVIITIVVGPPFVVVTTYPECIPIVGRLLDAPPGVLK